jgi:hypothetical protein
MISKTYAVALMTVFLVGAALTSAQPAGAAGRLGLDLALVPASTIDVSTKHPSHRYYRGAHYGYSRSSLPYDGYRPYPLPIYHCSFFYPYCWGW